MKDERVAPAWEPISGERQFRLLVQSVVDYAIFMLDPTGVIRSWNAGAARMKGYAADEIIGQHFSSFYTPEDRAAGVPQRALATALSEGKFEAEGWRLRKDGTRFWASVVIDPIRDETGTLRGFAKVTRDITERRKAQQALDEAREALAQAQKMEAVGQLTGGVAHDFNNLLQAISSSLELIEQRLSAGRTDIAPFAATARAAVDRAATLTRRLLAFARRQPLKPERTDLNMLVVGLWDLLGRSVGEEIRLERRLAEPLWPVHADVNQIESALLNLVINARDAMPDGGSVTVETANAVFASGDLVNDPGVEPGDYAVLTVRDSGTGMPPDVLARVFEPFFTTKPIGQGTGLGLSQLYGFARQSGGFVRIDSAVGRGTAVHLHLPRDDAAAEQAAPAPASAAVPAPPTDRAGRGTVLVVEDEELVRMLLVEVLEGDGYTVLEAADGATALARLSEAAAGREGAGEGAGPPVDLLVTDVGLPGLNGRQLAEAAKAHYPDLKVLFLTGYAFQALDDRPGDGEDGLGRNMRLLAKPVAVDAFRAMVRSMLSDG
ncbi:PAS domain S-box protein (plasmid) [Azospirillum oryzae]|uniref:histidine kinase n=1 Tax=Azospirillum oryzae TaxID=286727 RepID=A0A6N1ABQ0_9PROT|nr:PAS domain-containing sensor histidine kinase [Azospirillum oryzae]KAA0586730.1 PAS domain S-box protein [Azospirillum oryzae]QKS48956.1 PAS domain S-box protein [Azospirillum oryzae]GLR83009.1 histidine kinase [Azospirillum oryzae]